MQKAAEVLGGHAKLCRALRVPADELQKWIDDKTVPPIAIFLRAVDVVIDEAGPPAASDPADPPAPRDCSAANDSSSTLY